MNIGELFDKTQETLSLILKAPATEQKTRILELQWPYDVMFVKTVNYAVGRRFMSQGDKRGEVYCDANDNRVGPEIIEQAKQDYNENNEWIEIGRYDERRECISHEYAKNPDYRLLVKMNTKREFCECMQSMVPFLPSDLGHGILFDNEFNRGSGNFIKDRRNDRCYCFIENNMFDGISKFFNFKIL